MFPAIIDANPELCNVRDDDRCLDFAAVVRVYLSGAGEDGTDMG